MDDEHLFYFVYNLIDTVYYLVYLLNMKIHYFVLIRNTKKRIPEKKIENVILLLKYPIPKKLKD